MIHFNKTVTKISSGIKDETVSRIRKIMSTKRNSLNNYENIMMPYLQFYYLTK